MTTRTDGEKRVFTFGDFIVAAYRAWGSRQAKELVQVAVNAHLVVFQRRQRFVIWEE